MPRRRKRTPFAVDPEKKFRFQLALALGRTVEELGASMSHSEFVEWMQFSRHEPFGELRDDYRIANLGMQMASMWCGKKGQKFSISDYLLQFQHHSRLSFADQMRQNALLMAAFTKTGPPEIMKAINK